jgi:hypothetical protein
MHLQHFQDYFLDEAVYEIARQKSTLEVVVNLSSAIVGMTCPNQDLASARVVQVGQELATFLGCITSSPGRSSRHLVFPRLGSNLIK